MAAGSNKTSLRASGVSRMVLPGHATQPGGLRRPARLYVSLGGARYRVPENAQTGSVVVERLPSRVEFGGRTWNFVGVMCIPCAEDTTPTRRTRKSRHGSVNRQVRYDHPGACGVLASCESGELRRFSVDLTQISTLVSFGGNPSHLSPFTFPGRDDPVRPLRTPHSNHRLM